MTEPSQSTAEDRSPAPTKAFIGAEEVARLLGVSRRTVYRWTLDGILPIAFYTPAGNVRYNRAAILAIREGGHPELTAR